MNAKENKELTKAEEQVMQAVWKVDKGFANEIVAAVEGSTASYNTVLSVVRTLEQKGYVSHVAFNRNNQYFPMVSREEYMQHQLSGFAKRYFGSARALVSFLVDKNEVSLEDLEAISKEIES